MNRGAAIILLSIAVSCDSSESATDRASAASSGATGGGGAGGASSYGSSACGTCVQGACGTERDACAADPTCAAYLSCLDGCPVAPDGNVDAACEAGCPAVSGAAAEMAKQAFTTCRTTGPGVACAACGSGAGGQGVGGSGGRGSNPILHQECAMSTSNNPCFVCEDEQCCDTQQACLDSPACQALMDCVQACPDDPCWLDCYDMHPDGLATFAPRLACLSVFCFDADACGNGPLPPCATCTNAKCAEPFVDCASDPECYVITECAALCPQADQACIEGCINEHPAAEQAFQVYLICVTDQCSAECG